MNKDLKIDRNQTQTDFFKGMKVGYEKYIGKEERKMKKIREMIKDF